MIYTHLTQTVEALEIFKDALPDDLSPRTLKCYHNDIQHFLEWLDNRSVHCGSPLCATGDDLGRYCEHVQHNYSYNTARRRLGTLRRFYTALAARGVVYEDLPDAIEIPSTDRSSRPSVAIMDTTPVDLSDRTGRGYRNQAIIGLALGHGLPATEIAKMHCDDVVILDNLTGILTRNDGRLVNLSMRTPRYLKAWLDVRRVLGINSPYIFTTIPPGRGHLSPRTVRDVISMYLKGLKHD